MAERPTSSNYDHYPGPEQPGTHQTGSKQPGAHQPGSEHTSACKPGARHTGTHHYFRNQQSQHAFKKRKRKSSDMDEF